MRRALACFFARYSVHVDVDVERRPFAISMLEVRGLGEDARGCEQCTCAPHQYYIEQVTDTKTYSMIMRPTVRPPGIGDLLQTHNAFRLTPCSLRGNVSARLPSKHQTVW